MAPSPRERRQFFIKKEFQGKFILLYALATVGLSALVTSVLYFSMMEELDRHLYSSHLKIERIGEVTNSLLLKANVFSILGIVVLILGVSLVVFKRLNAHFFRMEGCLGAMSRGDFSTPPLPASRFNEISNLIGMVGKSQGKYREQLDAIGQTLDELERGAQGTGNPDILREGYAKLNRIVKEVDLPTDRGA